MNKSSQILIIGVLFLALILISAGIGALVAGESLIGLALITGGSIILVSDLVALYFVRKRSPE